MTSSHIQYVYMGCLMATELLLIYFLINYKSEVKVELNSDRKLYKNIF